MTQQPASPEFLALQRAVIGRYSLVRELGRGGMGIVFLAHDVALDRPVAIKMLPLELSLLPEQRAKFLREARTAASLAHPNIVPIHAVEEQNALVFFVMAFVDGETLGARIEREGMLAAGEGMQILQQVAWALGHAHARGIVHRDVKPDNILLEHGSGRALVTDFGIAQVQEAMDTTGQGRVIGTPRYMSPEQASGEPVDPRSDVYSLGCVAYHALAGRPPFDDASMVALITKHAAMPAPPILGIRPTLPVRLAAVVDRCLAKERADRFGTGEDVAGALRDAVPLQGDFPAPVRRFVREFESTGIELSGPLAATVTALVMTGVSYARSRGADVSFFDALGFSLEMVAYVGVATAMLGLAALRIGQLAAAARRLLREGYGHSAVVPAVVVHDRAREEDAVPAPRPSRVGLLLRVAATVACIRLLGVENPVIAVLALAGTIVIPTFAIRGLFRDLQKREGWWSRMMRGGPGKLLFKLAGWRLGGSAPRTPSVGEPTVHVLGRAVDDLFKALPPVRQREFAELPDLAARLEADAMALRARANGGPGAERYRDALGAIEMLRLDLLRLQVDGEPQAHGDLTRDIDAASRLGDEIRRALEARREASEG